jgi:hypothetical protein
VASNADASHRNSQGSNKPSVTTFLEVAKPGEANNHADREDVPKATSPDGIAILARSLTQWPVMKFFDALLQ